MISEPQRVSRSKDAEKCKKSKSEIFALTGLLHPTDDIMTHQVVTHSEYGNKQIQQKLQSTFLQPNDNRNVQILEFWVHDHVCNN